MPGAGAMPGDGAMPGAGANPNGGSNQGSGAISGSEAAPGGEAVPRCGSTRGRGALVATGASSRLSTTLASSLVAVIAAPHWQVSGGSAGSGAMEPPPPSAAELYRRAFLLLEGDAAKGVPPLLSVEQRDLLQVIDPREMTPQVRAALELARPVLELARQAAEQPTVDFGLDRSQGFETLLPHLAPMRQIARLVAVDIAADLADGRVERAKEQLAVAAAIASHAAQDEVLISALVGNAVGGLAGKSIDAALATGLVAPEDAAEILAAFDRLAGTDPYGYAAAVEAEGQLFRDTVAGPDQGPGSIFFELMAPDGELPEEISQMTPEGMADQLAAMDLAYARAAEAFREPDPTVARAALAEIERQVESGELGLLAQRAMPALSRAYDSKQMGESMLQARLAKLRDIASGRVPPSTYANAAIWYLKAAREARMVPEDEQRLIEGLRVVDGGLQGPLRSTIDRAIARHGGIVELILLGAEAGQCRFEPEANADRLIGLPQWAGGLRAAARVVIADIYRLWENAKAPSAAAEPPPAVRAARDAIAARFRALVRVVDHLSSDPSIAHAALAQSILDETRLALIATIAAESIDAESLQPLAAAIAALNRVDCLGVRRGVAADRERLVRRGLSDPDAREARRRALAAFDGGALHAIALAFECVGEVSESGGGAADAAPEPLLCDCGEREFHALVDLSDLLDPVACAALAERAAELRRAPLLTARDAESIRRGATLEGGPPPAILDVAGLAAQAIFNVGELDALVLSVR